MFIWTITDFAAVVTIGLCFIGIFLIKGYAMWIQWRCEHSGRINETLACDAICAQCGKNLGFIGAWRAAQKDKP